MSQIIASIIFSIALLWSPVALENPRQDCILSGVLGSLGMTKEHFETVSNHIKIMDFTADSEVNKNNLLEQLDMIDASTYSELQLLLTSESFLPILQPLIQSCQLNVERTKRRCEKIYGEGNCVALTPFVYGHKCEAGYEAYGVSYCLPKCPIGFVEDKKDPFLCQKSSHIVRSKEIVEESPKGIYKYNYYRNLKYLACPDGFNNWGLDFCVQKCPLGFNDLGMSCQKPLIQKREFELFIYDVSVDDFLVTDTQEVQY